MTDSASPTATSPVRTSHLKPLSTVLLALWLALVGSAIAQVCNYEVEPNDDPGSATTIAASLWQHQNEAAPVCLSGAFTGGDQDFYRWDVSQVEALHFWTVELHGIPSQVTLLKLYRVHFAADAVTVTGSEELLALSTSDGGQVTSDAFMLEPGTYYLGTSASGGAGEYVAQLAPAGRIDRSSSQIQPGRSSSNAHSLSGAVDGEIALQWTIDTASDGYLWGLNVRSALGTDVRVSVLAGSNEVVSVRSSLSAHRSGVGLAAGTYTVLVSGESGAMRLDVTRQGRRNDGVEVEPNDQPDTATALAVGSRVAGTFDGNDYYRFDLDKEQAQRTWDLDVQGTAPFSLYLESAERQSLLTRREIDGFSGPLTLPTGGYVVRIDGREGTYTVALRPGAAPAVDFEVEPNDVASMATAFTEAGLVRGSLEPLDRDVFSLTVTGGAQLYRFQALGPGANRLRLLDGRGGAVAEVRGESRLRLDDMLLLPGTHLIEVTGTSGDYALRAIPLGPAPAEPAAATLPATDEPLVAAAAGAPPNPDPETFELAPAPVAPPGRVELESNDDPSRAVRMMPGMVHVGRLGSVGDNDYYRFHLLADQYARVELVPPEGGVSIPMYLAGVGWFEQPRAGPGSPVVIERRFLAGDHSLQVGMRGGSDAPSGYYQLRLTLLDSALLPVDAEPNDDRRLAGSLPAELRWHGFVGEVGDDDLYRLPTFPTGSEVRVEIDSESDIEVALLSQDGTLTSARRGDALATNLAASQTHYLRLRGRGPYRLTVAFSEDPDPAQLLAPRDSDALALSLTHPSSEVAAFWHQGQMLSSQVTVVNTSAATQVVEFEVVASDARAVVPTLPALSLGAGESRTIDVDVAFPPELRDDQGLRVDIAVRSTAGSASAGYSATPLCEASPVMPFEHHGIRRALAGRLDVLWQGLGAAVHGATDRPARDAALIDGRVTPATGGSLDTGHSPTFELAGDQPLRVVGALLNPLAGVAAGEQLKGFRIETSLDGTSFVTAFEGELASAAVEQEFEFAAPVSARFARLVFVSSHDGRERGYLGEFKLLAEEFGALGQIDLADERLGGHIAWSTPLLPSFGRALLTQENDVGGAIDTHPSGAMSFVLGFHDARAAQVQRLGWRDSPRSVGDRNPTAATVLVELSLAGPAGPWQTLVEWELQRGASGSAELELPESVWARYLRFTAPAGGDRYLWPPDELSVYERRADGSYRSAVGEWGMASSSAIYEASMGGATPPQLATGVGDDPGDSPQTARRLVAGTTIKDSVMIAEDVDWLVFQVPNGENHFEVTLAGDPAIGFAYRLLDSELEPVAFEVNETGDHLVLSGFAEPGDYYLQLEEPKRTVVFAWDNSGSVGPYEAIIYNSLASFALGVDGQREAVQLLAFSDPRPRWLMPLWSSDPERVQLALVQYDRSDSSSNSEAALLDASRALAQRDGTRAILLITDAESNGYALSPELWASLQGTRPRIFTFEVSSGGNAIPQDLMQDWAQINGGSYQMAASVGDVDAGFARAACILRRAKGYTASVATRYQAPPGPGTLTLLRDPAGPAPAVEVIFDASGSMGRTLPSGEQRIVAARRALELLVGEVLPDDTQFALRAFGHIAPSSCETRLDLPLAPLDRTRAAAAVRAIEPKLLSQTPLADSLAAVASDLAQAASTRIVILITDGEESCGGDPAAAVEGLKTGGPLELAIVSLALEPTAQRVFESLAASVGASYVDVGSFEELEASIREALNPAYEVLDQSGRLVASGRVGDAGAVLPMGYYSVRVLSTPAVEYREVRVPGDGSVTLSVGAQ